MMCRRATALLALAAVAAVAAAASPEEPWRGVDLSYVNELEDCGARYASADGPADPYEIFARAGANVVRLRLWHDPEWTRYSTLADVKKSIRRARASGMSVYLDFHYSDDWAHPGKQLRPASWPPADDVDALAAKLADYTRSTLVELRDAGLFPDVVSIGNEINTNLLIDEETAEDAPIDWPRNAKLLNAAIAAARSVTDENGKGARLMLHVAQPENLGGWLEDARHAGVVEFDLVGLSYYPKWSSTPFDELGPTLVDLRQRFGKDIVVVETAYPWTLQGNDAAANLLGEDSLVDDYPATIDGQARYLEDLATVVEDAGGLGVVYWEPAWISSNCSTRWGDGSHWENAALFDFDGRLHDGARFLGAQRRAPADSAD